MIRYAIVKNADSRRQLEAYLPDNYRIIFEHTWQEHATQTEANECELCCFTRHPAFVIEGKDHAGWGLDTYVIPRLGSGMIYATEIDLSHPIMKHVPVEA